MEPARQWAMVAAKIGGTSAPDVRTRLKLITNRRNAIVHEADMDPLTNAKTPITAQECEQAVSFLLGCGGRRSRIWSFRPSFPPPLR